MQKRTSNFSLLFVAFATLLLTCCKTYGTVAKQLEDNGFTDILRCSDQKSVYPLLFLDKYDFIQSGTNCLNVFDLKTGTESLLIHEPSWDGKLNKFSLYTIKDNVLFFSQADYETIRMYSYNIEKQILNLLLQIPLTEEREFFPKYSFYEESTNCFYVIQSYSNIIEGYNISSMETTFIAVPDDCYVVSFLPSRNAFLLRNNDDTYALLSHSGSIETLSIAPDVKYDDIRYINEINENTLIGIHRKKRKVSEIYAFDFEENKAKVVALKDFPFEIWGLFKIPDDSYCFVLNTDNEETVFCYFDYLETLRK